MSNAYYLRTLHLKSWCNLPPVKLNFDPTINFLVGRTETQKTVVFEAIRFGLRGNDKKIDPTFPMQVSLSSNLPNIELVFQGVGNSKALMLNRVVKKDKSLALKLSGHLLHPKWYYQELEEDAGHEASRYLMATTNFSSLRYLNYFSFERASLGLVYFQGNKEITRNYMFLTQVIREIGREITEKRRQQGVVIDNYRNSLRRLNNLQSSLEPLKQKMRGLRKQLARLHRSSAAKTYLLMLQSRQLELQEQMLRMRNKYLVMNDFEEGIEKRIEQLKTDVNVGKKELELLLQDEREKKVRYMLLDELNKRLQDSINQNKTVCPICLRINVTEEHLLKEKRKIKNELNDLQFDLEAIDHKLLTARGFLERSQAMLYEALRDKERWEQILRESKTVQKTLKQLAVISPKGKETSNLKKVEDELRVLRNKHIQTIREIGRLEGKLGMSAEQGVQEITKLEDLKVITKFLEDSLKESIIQSFKEELDSLNLFFQSLESILGGIILIDNNLKLWFKKGNGSYQELGTLPLSLRLLVQLVVQVVLVSMFLPIKLVIIDEVFSLLDVIERRKLLKVIEKVSNVQAIILCHPSDLSELDLTSDSVNVVDMETVMSE